MQVKRLDAPSRTADVDGVDVDSQGTSGDGDAKLAGVRTWNDFNVIRRY